MLSQINRLKKKKDFEEVFKKGKKIVLPESKICLRFKKNNLENSRFGFIIGKKFSKKAPERNKLKRQIREIIKKNIPNAKKGRDAVIVIFSGFEPKDFLTLENTINRLLNKAELIDKNA